MTSRYCPLGEMLIEEVKETLDARFAETPSIQVELVWSPPWSLDRMSKEGRRQLGWAKRPRWQRRSQRPQPQ